MVDTESSIMHPVGIITTYLELPDGTIVGKDVRHNMFTDAGMIHVSELMAGLSTTHFTHIQVGLGGIKSGYRYALRKPKYYQTELNNFYEEREATRTYTNGAARFQAMFMYSFASGLHTLPYVSEAGLFSGPHGSEPAPVPLSLASFTPIRERYLYWPSYALIDPNDPYVRFYVTWNISFQRDALDMGYLDDKKG